MVLYCNSGMLLLKRQLVRAGEQNESPYVRYYLKLRASTYDKLNPPCRRIDCSNEMTILKIAKIILRTCIPIY